MGRKNRGNGFARFFKSIYLKLFRINDTPQRIAIGVGLGVFCGAFPGTGPIAALFLAFVLRLNRAAALLGSILTNTWLSIPIFLISVKLGSVITSSNYADLQRAWMALMKDFRWADLFEMSFSRIVFPVLAGYLAVSFLIGVLAYTATLAATALIKCKKRTPHTKC